MSVSVNTMRKELAKLYEGISWKNNVLNNWSDARVIAVYYSCLKYDRFNKKKKADKKNASDNGYYKQMTIFDYI